MTQGTSHEMADPVFKHACIMSADDVGKGDDVDATRGLQVAGIGPGAVRTA